MKYDKNLIKLIEEKNFKTFWHCLDYLLLAGYSAIEAFGVALKHFGESRIFSSVAFIRMERWEKNHLTPWNDRYNLIRQPSIIIGLIDDSNIHFDGLYKVYRENINDRLSCSPEIEETCEIIKISSLTPVIIHYLSNQSEKHFGVKSFIISKQMTFEEEINQNDIEDNVREAIRKLESMGGIYCLDPNNEYNSYLPPPSESPIASIINLNQEMQKRRNGEEL